MLSYLSPSMPQQLFVALANHLEVSLGTDIELAFDSSRSGPRLGEDEPFTSGVVDLAFLCATSYIWLSSRPTPAVDLAGIAWVPTDPRAGGRPIYFGDLLVRHAGLSTLEDLRGHRVAFNDEVSLSGYHSLRLALSAAGVNEAEVDWHRSGSHLASLRLLTTGAVDAAAVDSNVWKRLAGQHPRMRQQLRPIFALGPHPVQPLVLRRGIHPKLRDAVAQSLLDAMSNRELARAMKNAQLAGFTSVTDDDYAHLRTELAGLGLDGAAETSDEAPGARQADEPRTQLGTIGPASSRETAPLLPESG